MQTQQQKKYRKEMIRQSIQGAASMGRTYALLGGGIFIGLGAFLIIIGSWLHNDRHTRFVTGKIIQKDCKELVSSFQYHCQIKIQYEINGQRYEKLVKNYNTYSAVHQGDEITLYVDPKNPADAILSKSPEWLNILMIIIGCLFILFSSIYVYYICAYKGLAVLSGLKKVVLEN